MFGAFHLNDLGHSSTDMVQEVDLCLSSPEECSSGNATPKGAQLGTRTMLADVETQVEVATPPSPSTVVDAEVREESIAHGPTLPASFCLLVLSSRA